MYELSWIFASFVLFGKSTFFPFLTFSNPFSYTFLAQLAETELTKRKLLMFVLLCSGIVIFGAALCLAIGVPIALEMQSQQQPSGYRAEIVRKLLSEVPLVDG
jgi:hypothetical protein